MVESGTVSDDEAVLCSPQVAGPAFGKEVSVLLCVRVSHRDGIAFEIFPISNL